MLISTSPSTMYTQAGRSMPSRLDTVVAAK